MNNNNIDFNIIYNNSREYIKKNYKNFLNDEYGHFIKDRIESWFCNSRYNDIIHVPLDKDENTFLFQEILIKNIREFILNIKDDSRYNLINFMHEIQPNDLDNTQKIAKNKLQYFFIKYIYEFYGDLLPEDIKENIKEYSCFTIEEYNKSHFPILFEKFFKYAEISMDQKIEIYTKSIIELFFELKKEEFKKKILELKTYYQNIESVNGSIESQSISLFIKNFSTILRISKEFNIMIKKELDFIDFIPYSFDIDDKKYLKEKYEALSSIYKKQLDYNNIILNKELPPELKEIINNQQENLFKAIKIINANIVKEKLKLELIGFYKNREKFISDFNKEKLSDLLDIMKKLDLDEIPDIYDLNTYISNTCIETDYLFFKTIKPVDNNILEKIKNIFKKYTNYKYELQEKSKIINFLYETIQDINNELNAKNSDEKKKTNFELDSSEKINQLISI
jgi:hypothetical protein